MTNARSKSLHWGVAVVCAGLSFVATPADAAPSAGACVWADGQDPTGPKDDQGRGVSDWKAHRAFVLNPANAPIAPKLVNARLAALKGCLDKESYARVYADVSILVASYGRASAGWVDGADASAPADDGGRGVAKWRAHYDYALGVGAANANKLVGDRFQSLLGKLKRDDFARLYADVSIVLANLARLDASAKPALTPCKWVDGTDAAAPTDDPGRGKTDWSAHEAHVLVGVGMTNASKLVSARMVALKACLDKDAYARLYADVSLLEAHYGRTGAGWKDGADGAAPADDGGRGIAKWSAHYEHAQSALGMGNASKLVGDRLQTLSGKLKKDVYARLYADLSILLVNYARMS